MKQGTDWILVNVWHDEDEPTEYRVKIKWQYEAGHYEDFVYFDGYRNIDVLEYPENITDNTRKMIDNQLWDELDEILANSNN